jgi:transmembrane sensor
MGSEIDSSLQMRAIEWHVRLRDGDDATWEAFVEWLALSPDHQKAYEIIEQADQAIEPLLPAVVVFRESDRDVVEPTSIAARSSRRWWVTGVGLAASIAAAALLVPQLASSRYEVSTQPGERQTVTLDSTTQVILNGATRMTFDRHDPRFAALESGEALFHVRHDDTHPFTLEIGNDRVRDVGTEFNVVRDHGSLRVAVAEGKVVYSSPTQTVPLNPGQALSARSGSGDVRVTAIPILAIGAWEKGRLVYSGAPLAQVAVDLGRSLGVQIVVSPDISDRLFSGSIVLNGAPAAQLERLKMALNVDLVVGPQGWTMKPVDNGS